MQLEAAHSFAPAQNIPVETHGQYQRPATRGDGVRVPKRASGPASCMSEYSPFTWDGSSSSQRYDYPPVEEVSSRNSRSAGQYQEQQQYQQDFPGAPSVQLSQQQQRDYWNQIYSTEVSRTAAPPSVTSSAHLYSYDQRPYTPSQPGVESSSSRSIHQRSDARYTSPSSYPNQYRDYYDDYSRSNEYSSGRWSPIPLPLPPIQLPPQSYEQAPYQQLRHDISNNSLSQQDDRYTSWYTPAESSYSGSQAQTQTRDPQSLPLPQNLQSSSAAVNVDRPGYPSRILEPLPTYPQTQLPSLPPVPEYLQHTSPSYNSSVSLHHQDNHNYRSSPAAAIVTGFATPESNARRSTSVDAATRFFSPQSTLLPTSHPYQLPSGNNQLPIQSSSAVPASPLQQEQWKAFQQEWQEYLDICETELQRDAHLGLAPSYTPRKMAAGVPTFDDCEALVGGMLHNHRITVDKVKHIIRGINSIPGLPLTSLKMSGKKQDLINQVIDVLRSLKNSRSAFFHQVARLVGEAQGHTYPSSSSSSIAATSQNGAPAKSSSSSGYTGASVAARSNYAAGYAQAGHAGASSSHAPGASQNASHSAQFGLPRSPGRMHTYTGYNGAAGSSVSGYGANDRYSNSPGQSYRQALPPPNGVLNGRPSGSGHSSASGINAQLPTSWPQPLPPVPRSNISGQAAVPMNFKSSPFFKIINAVSPVVTLSRPANGERATGTAWLTLSADQRQKLQAARDDPKATQYQLRLYCTSGDFYTPHTSMYGSVTRPPMPIEFPISSEAKLNDSAVVANLRGIKKKPGTAPPAHVSSALVGNPSRTSTAPATGPVGSYALKLLEPNSYNKVELVYMNTDKPYYMIVYYVEAYSVEQVIERIKRDKVRPKEDVLKSIHRAADDPDIQATSSTISLKDPLTFTTLNVPIRSMNCVHLQCFDAFTFLSMMESTPDWKCPVCNRAISAEELVHDGFFQDIKDSVPSSMDTVVVEVDGTWRTEDNKFGNAKKAIEMREAIANGTNGILSLSSENGSRSSSLASRLDKDGTPYDIKPEINSAGLDVPSHLANGIINGRPSISRQGSSHNRPPAAVIELDDDDDDEGNDTPPPPPRNGLGASSLTTAPTAASGRPAGGATSSARVIDLTLSDSEEDEGRGSSIIGLGSRAPSAATGSIYTPSTMTNTNTLGNTSTTLSANHTNATIGFESPSSASARATAGASASAAPSGSIAAGVKRRHDESEAEMYDQLWGREVDSNDNNNHDDNDGYNSNTRGYGNDYRRRDGSDDADSSTSSRPSQMMRYG